MTQAPAEMFYARVRVAGLDEATLGGCTRDDTLTFVAYPQNREEATAFAVTLAALAQELTKVADKMRDFVKSYEFPEDA